MPAIPMLLADWAEIIGFLVLVVFGVLKYLLTELGEGQKKKPAQRAAQPRPAPNAQAQRPRPAGVQGDLRSEVDEFLRRAKGGPEPAPEPLVELEPAEPPEGKPWKSDVRLDTKAAAESAQSLRRGTVAEHVQQHVGHLEESQLAENAARLGAQVALADDKVKARLEAKFDHSLGKLDRSKEEKESAQAKEEPEFAADQIAAMLASPEGVRNAVILNEILERPVNRW